MKSMFATIYNMYCIIQCKIQMICYINSQKLITVYIKKTSFVIVRIENKYKWYMDIGFFDPHGKITSKIWELTTHLK